MDLPIPKPPPFSKPPIRPSRSQTQSKQLQRRTTNRSRLDCKLEPTIETRRQQINRSQRSKNFFENQPYKRKCHTSQARVKIPAKIVLMNLVERRLTMVRPITMVQVVKTRKLARWTGRIKRTVATTRITNQETILILRVSVAKTWHSLRTIRSQRILALVFQPSTQVSPWKPTSRQCSGPRSDWAKNNPRSKSKPYSTCLSKRPRPMSGPSASALFQKWKLLAWLRLRLSSELSLTTITPYWRAQATVVATKTTSSQLIGTRVTRITSWRRVCTCWWSLACTSKPGASPARPSLNRNTISNQRCWRSARRHPNTSSSSTTSTTPLIR